MVHASAKHESCESKLANLLASRDNLPEADLVPLLFDLATELSLQLGFMQETVSKLWDEHYKLQEKVAGLREGDQHKEATV